MRLLVVSISLKNVFKLWHSNQKNERDISQNFFQKFKNGNSIKCVQIWSFFLVRIFPYSVKKGILRNFALFTGKHLSWSHFLIKLQARPMLYFTQKPVICFALLFVLCCFSEHLFLQNSGKKRPEKLRVWTLFKQIELPQNRKNEIKQKLLLHEPNFSQWFYCFPLLKESFSVFAKKIENRNIESTVTNYRGKFDPIFLLSFVGNKAKGRISKRMFQENKARQILRKTNISYPHTCAYQGVRNVRFSRNLTSFVFLKHLF